MLKDAIDLTDKMDPSTRNLFLGFVFMAIVVLFLMKKKDEWTAGLKKEFATEFDKRWEERKKPLDDEIHELTERVARLESRVTNARGLTFEALSIAGEVVDVGLRSRLLTVLRKLQETLG